MLASFFSQTFHKFMVFLIFFRDSSESNMIVQMTVTDRPIDDLIEEKLFAMNLIDLIDI